MIAPAEPAVREFIFVDESGDPGPNGNPIYVLVGMHIADSCLDRLNRHLTVFRYHHEVVREFKAQRWADKFSPPTRHLLGFLADMTDAGEIVTTVNWLQKETYTKGGGPHLTSGETWKFRHFQLRLLLERHLRRSPWSVETDLVVDRWKMSLEQRANLEEYLRGNLRLRPLLAAITFVDSLYCYPVQVVDIYGRMARRLVQGKAMAEEAAMAGRLMDLVEIRGGLYP